MNVFQGMNDPLGLPACKGGWAGCKDQFHIV
jgi:hypothetical protein